MCANGKKIFKGFVTTDFYPSIKGYNLAGLWIGDSILIEDREQGRNKIHRHEPIGYIDTTFQRFYIHFLSITKRKNYPYVYDVFGKIRIKNIIRTFQGTIKILDAVIQPSEDIPKYRVGEIGSEILFYEDKNNDSSGFIKGSYSSLFLIDSTGRLRYDAIMAVADGYWNNQFEGNWTSYKTKLAKKCRWGDFRIPDSRDLDGGAGEFIPMERYWSRGWFYYTKAFDMDNNEPEVKKAKQEERRKW